MCWSPQGRACADQSVAACAQPQPCDELDLVLLCYFMDLASPSRSWHQPPPSNAQACSGTAYTDTAQVATFAARGWVGDLAERSKQGPMKSLGSGNKCPCQLWRAVARRAILHLKCRSGLVLDPYCCSTSVCHIFSSISWRNTVGALHIPPRYAANNALRGNFSHGNHLFNSLRSFQHDVASLAACSVDLGPSFCLGIHSRCSG